MKVAFPILISFLLFNTFCASAQSVDDMLRAAKKEHDRLLELSAGFKEEVRKQWMEYLNRPWTPVEAEPPLQRPLEDNPDLMMIPLESYDYNVGETFEVPSSVLVMDKGLYAENYFAEFPVYEEKSDVSSQVNIPLNGFEILVRYPVDGKINLEGNSEADVASALADMSQLPLSNTLRDLSRARELLSLSDWSFVKMVDKLSAVVCKSKSSPEAVLLQAYILNAFGFNMCIGRADDGCICKLIETDAYLYDFASFRHGGLIFYHLDGNMDEVKMVDMIDLPSDSRRPMRMRMNPDERFHMNASREMKFAPERYPNLFMAVSTDLSRMDFYADYPMYYTEGGPLSAYYHYAMMPMSEEVRDAVYPLLRRAVAGRSELEAVNILLNLVQTAFPYARDVETWGVERYFFPDELWRYGEGDCEDKSILFSRLVRDVLGLPVALVYWPGHLSCAVCFTDEVKGAYFHVGKERYVSCDPTYENAYAGAVMNDYKIKKAELILLP